MHKSGRTLPSAHGFADHPATGGSLLKQSLRRQKKIQFRLLTDLFEEAFHRFQPSTGSRVVTFAASSDEVLELLQK